jgi:hypothetical protein
LVAIGPVVSEEKINLVKQNPATNRNENKLRTYCKFKFIEYKHNRAIVVPVE